MQKQKLRERNCLVVDRLRELGVREDQFLRLEFFFYTDRSEFGDAMAGALRAKGYEAEADRAAHDRKQYVISGWSVPIRMDRQSVNGWCDEMCDLGLNHDCFFDGWGTNPEQ
jgi:hypothetical protein